MKLALGAVLLVLASLAALSGPQVSHADGIEVRSSTAQNRFPDGIQFSTALASNAEINSVRLRFRVLPDGVLGTSRPQCTTGATVTCNALIGSSAQSYMVPGAEVIYYWEIEDAGGGKLISPESRTTYQDTRYKWDSTKDGNLTVFFYQGTEQSNATVLRTARETIDKFSAIEGAHLDFPVKIWVYQSAREMQPAIASKRGNGPDNSVATLGEVSASDTALVSRDTDFLNIVRHEVTHIVTRAATAGGLGELPIWINEGLSTYAQKELLPGEASALDLAIKRNQALPLVSLGASARGSAGQVSIFYAQAGSVVTFMVDKLGQEKFYPFLQALRSDNLDGALKKAYGYDLNGLENEWRKAVGLPPIEASTAASTGNTNSLPTIVPFGAQAGSNSAATPRPGNNASKTQQQAEDSGAGVWLPLAIGLTMFVVGIGAGGFLLLRRRSPKPPTT